MSETYYLLAAISYGIFIVQFILSWFGGDTDLDVDLDGELDMDVSDIVSFKGLVHFVMGASLMAEADKVQAIEMAPALAVQKMIESGLTPEMVVQYKTVDQLAGIAQASAQMFEHVHLGQVTVYGNENTAGNFMAKTAENLNPALDLLRSIPFADTVKEMFGKKQVEATEFEEVK